MNRSIGGNGTSFRRLAGIVAGLLAVVEFTGASQLFGVENEVAAKPPNIAKAELTAKLEKIRSDQNLDSETKKRVGEILGKAQEDWNAGFDAEQSKLRLQRQLETAERELEGLRRRLETLPQHPQPSAFSGGTIEQLERRRDELERKLDHEEHGLRRRVERLERELSERTERLETIGMDRAETEDKLADLRKEWNELGEEDESPIMEAHRLALQSTLFRYEERLAELNAEKDWLESAAAERWLRTLKEIAEREVAQVEADLAAVEKGLEAERRRAASEQVEKTRQESLSVPAGWKAMAQEHQELAEESRRLTERLEEAEDEVHDAEKRLAALEAETEDVRQKIAAAGKNESLGLMIRQQRSGLPNVRRLRRNSTARGDELRALRWRLLEYKRLDQQSPDAETLVQMARSAGDANVTALTDDALQQRAEEFLTHREELLEQLEEVARNLITQLVNLDQTERRLITQTEATAQFYADQLLWMRSSALFGWRDMKRLDDSARWFRNQAAWEDVASTLTRDAGNRPVLYSLAAIGLLASWLTGRRSRKEGGSAVGNDSASGDFSLSGTIQTAFRTAIGAGFWPALMAFVAWRLEQAAVGSPWCLSVSHGLTRGAALAWPLEILRQSCAAGGLGQVHLGWTQETARRLSRSVAWFLPLGVVLMFLVGATEAGGNEVLSESLGRTVFLLLMGAGAIFCRRVLFAGRTTPSQVPTTMQDFLSWAIPAAPLGLGVLTFAGYFDTALRLAWRLEGTAWLWLILAGVHSACARWIAGELRQLEARPDAGAPLSDPSLESRKSIFARPRGSATRRLSPSQIGRQMSALLHTALVAAGIVGLAFLWSDVLPAVERNDYWTLWHATATQQVVEKTDGGSSIRTITRLAPVTVFDFGVALLIGAVTWVAARNIPGLVEILFLERLKLDAGGRFAVAILFRYALFVAGVVAACNRIHVGWSNVQWLVAAASVGLGFGLQDIFANFVSGIILLFERPIRIGDVITIGDTTGTVSQIRFRSTTIIDADRKELVVPNKDLITGKLLNWTLSDQTNRIVIRVGVSYGSDPEQVRRLLVEIALAHPAVLKEPAPTATFEEFGTSALIFVLRAFLPSLDDRSRVIHELHATIHDRFPKEGITIPAPTAAPPQPRKVTAA